MCFELSCMCRELSGKPLNFKYELLKCSSVFLILYFFVLFALFLLSFQFLSIVYSMLR